MQINARNEYAAPLSKVIEMMLDQGFNEDVCRAAGSAEATVTIEGEKVTRRLSMEAPEVARKFVKGTVTGVQETVWGPVQADGSRQGTARIFSPGHDQGSLQGTVTVYEDGAGTVVEYCGELTVNIPFIGKKLEKSAEPYLMEALKVEQSVGEQWLSQH